MFRSKEQQFDFYWKEIFDGLAYNPIEFNVYRFDQSMSLPNKFNKLYEMFKVLAMNNQEVMDYLKEFMETFDFKLETTIKDILIVWLNEGLLADVVREAINDEVVEARTDYLDHTYLNLKERLDLEKKEVTTQLQQTEQEIKDVAVNVKTFLCDDGLLVQGDGVHDDTTGIMKALEASTSVYFPKGSYKADIEITNQSLIGHSKHTTYLKPATENGFAVTIAQNGVWYGTNVENFTFAGYGGIRFGHEPYKEGDEYAGGLKVLNCNFTNTEKAIYKPYGNIGNSFEHCRFMNGNYHYFVKNENISTDTMHSGDDNFYKCHFDGAQKASVYFYESRLTDKIVFDDCIFEANPGFCIFAHNYTQLEAEQTQGIQLNNCHMENNSSNPKTILDDGIEYDTKSVLLINIQKFTTYNTQLNSTKLINSVVVADNPSNLNSLELDAGSMYLPKTPSAKLYQGNAYIPLIANSSRKANDPATVVTKPRTAIGVGTPETHVFSESFDNAEKSFSNGVNTITTNKVRDGQLFGGSAEITLPAGDGVYTYTLPISLPSGKWFVTTFDLKQNDYAELGEINIAGQSSFLMRNAQSLVHKSRFKWTTLASLVPPIENEESVVRLLLKCHDTSSTKLRMSALQIHSFDRLDEAVRFLDSRVYATSSDYNNGRAVVTYDNKPPTSGYWRRGDRVMNISVSVGSPKSWVCTVSGSPGTWVSEGSL